MDISSKLLKFKIYFGIFLFFFLLYIHWISSPERARITLVPPQDEDVSCGNFYIEDSIKQSPPRTILLWNKLFFDPRWTLPADTVGPRYFKYLQCPEYNCVVTNNKRYLPSVDMFDAVMIEGSNMLQSERVTPRIRNPAQLYVFHTIDPALMTYFAFRLWKRVFNLTMTCRLDSDVPLLFGSIEDIESGQIVAPALKPNWRQPPAVYTDQKLEAIVKAKTKFAVWFVSHCSTLSKREQIVLNLQQHVSVDVCGDCGRFKCKKFAKECDVMVDRDYKFYIAFENSLCVDYVSEKLFNALARTVIPVVLGGADYSRFAPPHSYIDANNFTDAQELAAYLTYLSDHPKEYIQYFWWRKYYRAGPDKNWCNLCAQMNTPNGGTKQHIIRDLEIWWMNTSCNMRPNIALYE